MISAVCVLEKSMAAEKNDFILRTTLAATCALLLEVVIEMVDNCLFWRILRTKLLKEDFSNHQGSEALRI